MKSINFLIFTLLCCFLPVQQVQPKIHDIRTMAGWYNCFHDDSKHLAPFNGFVCWETKFIEKMFRFGYVQTQEKKRGNGGTWTEAISGDATIKLLYELFQDIEGTLHLVQEQTHFAYYLTPELIGKTLRVLQDPAWAIQTLSTQANQKICFQENKKINGILKIISGKNQAEKLTALHTNPKYQAQCQNFYTQIFQGLFKINLESSLNESVGKSTKREIIKSANKFADLLTHALLESHDLPSIEEQKFIAYTPGYILLSFMYAKADNADQFRAYTAQLPPAVLKENAQEILNTKKFDNAWSCEQFDKVDKQFIQEHYEEICFTQINDQFYKLQTPPLGEIRFGGTIHNFHFISCSEEALYNFVLFILSKIGLYSTTNKIFDLENLEAQMSSWLENKQFRHDTAKLQSSLNDLRSLLEKFNTPQLIQSKECMQAWVEFVSNRDEIKYSRCVATDGSGDEVEKRMNESSFMYPKNGKNYSDAQNYREKSRDGSYELCELTGNPSTYVNLISQLLGLEFLSFEQICETFDLTIKNRENLENFNDAYVRELYSNNKPVLRLNLETSINNQPVFIKMIATIGHTYFINQLKEMPLYSSSNVSEYLYKKLFEDNQSNNLLMLYSSCPIANRSHNLPESLPIRYHQHLWFCRNLLVEEKQNTGILQLARNNTSPILKTLAQLQFENLIQYNAARSESLISSILFSGDKLDEWMLDLCQSIKKDEAYDYSSSLWIDLLRYFLRFHSQTDPENITRGKLIEYMQYFAKKESDVDAKIRLLLVNLLNSEELQSDADRYELLAQLINIFFDTPTQRNASYLLAIHELIFELKDHNPKPTGLLREILGHQKNSLFCSELPEDNHQKKLSLELEAKILNGAMLRFKTFYKNENDENKEILKEIIKIVLERISKLLKMDDSTFIKIGIKRIYDICSQFNEMKNDKIIQEIFLEKCLPLIQYLETYPNYFILKIRQDFFNSYVSWLTYYRTEMLDALCQTAPLPLPPLPQ